MSSTATLSRPNVVRRARPARAGRRRRRPRSSARRTAPLRQPVSTSQCPSAAAPSCLEVVVDRTALGAAAQVGRADRRARAGRSPRGRGPGRAGGCRAGRGCRRAPRSRVRRPGGGSGDVEGQLGAEAGGQAVLLGRLGEADQPVHAVVVGEGQRLEAEPHRLLDQFLGRGRAVEEAERGVRVQLGEGHLRPDALGQRERAVLGALARPGGGVAAVARAARVRSGSSASSWTGGRPDSRRSSSRHGISGLSQPMTQPERTRRCCRG